MEAEQESDAKQDSEDILFLISMLYHKRFILYVFISPESAYTLQRAKEKFLRKNHISQLKDLFDEHLGTKFPLGKLKHINQVSLIVSTN